MDMTDEVEELALIGAYRGSREKSKVDDVGRGKDTDNFGFVSIHKIRAEKLSLLIPPENR